MGRHTTSRTLRVGPKLWAHFLKRHFSCASLEPLNAQLLWPPVPFETFEFGFFPEPLAKRLTPKIFERAHDLGRNPDGFYTSEFHNPEIKFNLFERVVQRVPGSKYWLLREVAPFLRETPPSIDITADIARGLLDDLGLMVLERRCVAAWEHLSPESVARAENSTTNALFFHTRLPEYLALALSLTHLAVWNEPPEQQPNLSSRMLQLCPIAAIHFGISLEENELDLNGIDYVLLQMGIERASNNLGRHGSRSMSVREGLEPPALQRHIVLVPATEATQTAIHCLSKAANLQHKIFDPWRDSWPDIAEALSAVRLNTNVIEPSEAVSILSDAASKVPALFDARAHAAFQRYQVSGAKRAAGISRTK